MGDTGSSGKHGGGHKDRDRASDKSDRKAIERAKQERIKADRKAKEEKDRADKKRAQREKEEREGWIGGGGGRSSGKGDFDQGSGTSSFGKGW